MPGIRSFRGLVAGRVQGVGFRYFVRRQAENAGLDGFVRNLADGRVEFLLQGEVDAVDAVIEQIRLGPPHARVRELLVEEDERHAIVNGFIIR
jgi:acylphosphatase